MNCEEFVVPSLELALSVVKDSLRCLLHTILFSRSLGGDVAVEPVTFKSEVLGISYCRANHVGGPDIGQLVENKIREFSHKLSDAGSLVLVLSLYVPRQVAGSRKTLWDILSQPFDDKAVFERWKIQIDVVISKQSSDDEDVRAIASAASQTKDRVFYIIKRLNERMDHLPPPPTNQASYHFDISFEASTVAPPSMWSPKAIAQSIRSIPFIT
jgi:autophagy-related protein 101